MGIHRGLNIVRDGLLFGYDTGYGVADNSTATRFYPGEPTTNLVTTNLETLGTDGSGQSSVGTRTTIAPNHVRIVDVTSNTRQSHLIQGLTASTTYTVSIQFKKVTGTPTFRFQIQGYNNSSYVSTIKFTNTAETGLLDIDGWQTAKWTFTLPSNCNAARIWWQDGADYTTYTHTFELKNPQLEAKGHVTPYVSGTRSSTQSLIDLKRTRNINISGASFDSTGQPNFDGTDDVVSLGTNFGFENNSFSIESIIKWDGGSEDTFFSYKDSTGGTQKDIHWRIYSSGQLRFDFYSDSINSATSSIIADEWVHLVVTYDLGSDSCICYKNGEVLMSGSSGPFLGNDANSTAYIGAWGNIQYFGGEIPALKIYNSAITAGEVKQNFNAYKKIFNI